MSRTWERTTKEKVQQAIKKKQFKGRNKDADRIIDFISAAGGFDGHSSVQGVANMIYEYAPSEKQSNHEPKKDTVVYDYGYRRLENLRRGDKHFVQDELDILHAALVKAAGPDWGAEFQPEDLAKLTYHEFMSRAVQKGLTIPDGNFSPAVQLEITWLHPQDDPLTIRPVDPNASRLGGPRLSRKRLLKPMSSLPSHVAEENYFLQIRGAKPGRDRLFVIEAANEDQFCEKSQESYCGFPVSLLDPETSNLYVKDPDGYPFVFYDTPGHFAFFAVVFPNEWDFKEIFGADPTVENWRRGEFENFIQALKSTQHEYPEAVRIGWYGYKVE